MQKKTGAMLSPSLCPSLAHFLSLSLPHPLTQILSFLDFTLFVLVAQRSFSFLRTQSKCCEKVLRLCGCRAAVTVWRSFLDKTRPRRNHFYITMCWMCVLHNCTKANVLKWEISAHLSHEMCTANGWQCHIVVRPVQRYLTCEMWT